MRQPRRGLLAAVIALAAGLNTIAPASSAEPAAPAACTWSVSELPLPDGVTGGGSTVKITNGWIVGQVFDQGTQAVLWRGDQVQTLPAPDDADVFVTDVNRAGLVVGATTGVGNEPQALLWRRGTAIPLGRLPGQTNGGPTAINDSGLIVGIAWVDRASHGVLWSADRPAVVHDLGTLDGSFIPTGITDTGIVVGYTYGGGTSRAVAGRPGRIATAPGLDPAGSSLIDAAAGAYWLGSGRPADGSYDDLLWRGARPALLPSGFDGSGVNRHGAVAGFLEQSGQPAVVTGGQVQVLPTPPGTGPYGSAAIDIDDDGTVVGIANGHPIRWSCTA